MAQQDLLLPWLTALDNVLIGYRLRGGRIDAALRDRARHLLQRVGLGHCVTHSPAALSGGMRQRVALARTLMEDRPVVLMDEPFSGLDAITRYELQALAAELLEGRTVLLVTHDPLEALRLSHRMLVLTGRPARLDAEVQPPPTSVPRHAADSDLLELQAQLLGRLGAPGGLTA
jgi:putative hydroxymethylpyrimidine transport system ATP-binding protein